MSNPVPDWLPDWRIPEAYPDPTEASPQEMAWEFLRRNSDYQTSYNEYQAILEDLAHNDPDVCHLLNSPRARAYTSSLEFLKNDPVARSLLDITPEVLDFCQPVQQRFRVRGPGGLPDPAQKFGTASPTFLIELPVKVYSPMAKQMLSITGGMAATREDMIFPANEHLGENWEEPVRITRRSTEIIFTIDLASNYSGQVKIIRKICKREKERLDDLEIAKRTNNNWKTKNLNEDLLLIYDANLSDADPIALAQQTVPSLLTRDRDLALRYIRDTHDTAMQLINHDYIKLAAG